jgi:hypothetical protein
MGPKSGMNAKQDITNLLKNYFKANQDKLDATYIHNTDGSMVYCSLFLKEDTTDNRDVFFAVFKIPEIDYWKERVPVYINFYPNRFKDRINNAESVLLFNSPN